MTRFRRRVLSVFVFIAAAVYSSLPLSVAAATVVERAGFASIVHDESARTWTIASTGLSIVFGLDPTRDFEIVRATTPSGRLWIVGGLPDTVLQIGGQTVTFGSRGAGFVYRGVTTTATETRVQLDTTFDLPTARVRVTRHYAAVSGAPAFETWTTIAPLAGSVTTTDLNAFRLAVDPGTVRWINGLQGDNLTTPTDSAFTLQQRDLEAGEAIALGAQGRSSEQTVPWIAIDEGGDEVFFAGLMWSGAWALNAERTDLGIELTLGLGSMSTTSTAPIQGPHAVFGTTRNGLRGAAAAMRTFILRGLRGDRPFEALVTYNTWFTYGTRIDERSMREEMEAAAELGTELFVVDAGWYAGAGRDAADDFTSGLGSWRVDEERFPEGLAALTAHAHSLGMKLGLWVEPERVALSTVGRDDLAKEAWLATTGGSYGSNQAAQICLASAEARQWVLDQISRLVDEAAPDYIKWDNNFWINCDREGHSHGPSDGNFAHVNGLYDLLKQLRERYPGLLIENVSGGGNRLDLGMLRYSDVGWMDDRSAPSVHVRHNLGGLTMLFPPAYLFSFVMDHEAERLLQPSDLPLYFRSRSPGVLGLCFRTEQFSEEERQQIAAEIAIYKTTRGALATASATLLTPQAAPAGGPPWDVLQADAAGGQTIVLSAIQWSDAQDELTIRPEGLSPTATYSVSSVDAGDLGTATGEELMADGVTVAGSPRTAAHIIILQRQ